MADVNHSEPPKETSEAAPINLAPIGPGNYDRAWNDPPMFDTRVNLIGKAPPNKLNKRVAHPVISSSSSAPAQVVPLGSNPHSSVPLLPPMPPVISGVRIPTPGKPPMNVLILDNGNPDSVLK